MAIAKIILNGEVQMDVTSDTVEANKLLSGETATKNDGTKVTGTFVAPDPVIESLSVTPTESQQTFNESAISGYKPVTVGAIASDYVGSAIPLKSAADLTGLETYSGYRVQVQKGYYNQAASYNISDASINMSGPYFTYSLGYFSGAVNITTSGYARQNSYSFSQQLSTLPSQTITPGSESQYIPANRWLTGSQTIAAIPSTYIGSAIPMRSAADVSYNEWYGGLNIPSGYYDPSVTISTGYIYPINLTRYISSNGALYVSAITSWKSGYLSETSNRTGTAFAAYDLLSNVSNVGIYGTSVEAATQHQARVDLEVNFSNLNNIYYVTSSTSFTDHIILPPGSYVFPSGTYSVTENGTYDIGSYASVDVNVAGGGGSWPNDTVLSEFYIFQQRSSSFTVPSSISNGDLVAVTGAIGSFSGGTTTSYTIFNDEWVWDGKPHTTVVESIPGGISATFITTSSYISVTSWPAGTQNTIKLDGRFNKREHDSEYLAFLNKCVYGQYSNSKITNIPAEHFYKYGLLSNISMDAVSQIKTSAFADCYKLREVTFMNASLIYDYAFQYDFSLSRVIIPNCDTIGLQAFNSCTSLSSLNVENVKCIYNGAFKSCIMLSEISLPVCSRIEAAAFSSCRNLNSVYSPECGYFGASAFWSCTSLTSINFDNCTTVGSSAFFRTALPSVNASMLYDISQAGFASCQSLSYVSMPFVSILYSYTFNNNSELTTVYAPTLKSVGSLAFQYCSLLERCEAGEELSYIGSFAFGHCYSLSRFTVGANNNTFDIGSRAFWSCINLSEFYIFGDTKLSIGYPRIFAQAFTYCSSLFRVYLLTGSVVSLPNGSGIFTSTPMVSSVDGRYGSIYVPESLYADYISHASWSMYSERFVSLTETEINAIVSSFYLRPTGGIWNSDTDLSGRGSIYHTGLTNRRLSDMIGHSVIFRLCPIKNPGSQTVTIVKDFPLFSSMTIPNSPFSLSFDYISQSTGTTLCHYDFTINFSEMSYSYAFTSLYGFYLDWILND